MRGASISFVMAACAASPARAPISNARAPAGETIAIDFATTTRAFHERGTPRPGDPPERLDDRPCPAAGPAWPEAEDATLAALARALPTVRVLSKWQRAPFASRHADAALWLDEHRAISLRRYHGDPVLDVSVRITRDGGYLELWGPGGSQVYCFDVERAGDASTLVPRLVDDVDT